jgi:hypothetical protein
MALDAQPFPCARGLGHRHAQTIWSSLFRRDRPRAAVQTDRWATPEGHLLALDLLPHRPGQPGVLVLHGLEASSRAPYVRGLLAAVEQQGWNGAAVSFRSCEPGDARGWGARRRGSAPPPPSPEAGIYHSGDTRDVGPVLERLRAAWGPVPLGAVGFSLGANVLLKWLGEEGDHAALAAAAAVSTPFDLAACADAVDAPELFAGIYRRRFLRSLRRKALVVASRHPDRFDAAAIRACATFRGYDDLVTAPIFGFAGAVDYWTRCSSAGFLARVRRPTLLISAEDDPIVPGSSIPRAAIAANPFLQPCLFDRGGHVGFVSGSPWRPRYAVDRLALEFLAPRLAPALPSPSPRPTGRGSG